MLEAEVTGLSKVEVIVIRDTGAIAEIELLPDEREFVFTINGTVQARFGCTPHRVRALIAGWLVTEGIVNDPSEFLSLEIDVPAATAEIRVTDACMGRLEDRISVGPITLFGDPPFDRVVDAQLEMAPERVAQLSAKFRKLFASLSPDERMCYLCAIGTADEILAYGEGFHRVNALLRAVGEVVINGQSADGKIALMNFGPSHHMVAKLARAGIAMAIFFAAPTTAAIELANQHYLTLIQAGVKESIRVYSAPWRVI